MKKYTTLLVTNIVFVLICLVSLSVAEAVEEKMVSVATGNVTGVYYPIGGAICRMVNKDRNTNGVRCIVDATEGSIDNLKGIISGKYNLAIAQADSVFDAYNGAGSFSSTNPNKDLRLILSLYSETFTIIAKKDSSIKSFADIKGKKVNIGQEGSGSGTIFKSLIASMNMSDADFAGYTQYSPSEQAEGLCNGSTDVLVFNVGHPNTSLQEVARTCETKIIPVPSDIVKNFIAKNPFYSEATIPGGIYLANPNDISSFGVKAMFVASDKTEDTVIYNVTKAIFENLESFKAFHPTLERLKIEDMVLDSGFVPLHNGAKEYYKQKFSK